MGSIVLSLSLSSDCVKNRKVPISWYCEDGQFEDDYLCPNEPGQWPLNRKCKQSFNFAGAQKEFYDTDTRSWKSIPLKYIKGCTLEQFELELNDLKTLLKKIEHDDKINLWAFTVRWGCLLCASALASLPLFLQARMTSKKSDLVRSSWNVEEMLSWKSFQRRQNFSEDPIFKICGGILTKFHTIIQGILKGEVSLYHWPPVWLVWNQLWQLTKFVFIYKG